MSIADTILSAFGAEEQLTNAQICERTGFALKMVATYTARLRNSGLLKHVDSRKRPVSHRLAGAALTRAAMKAHEAEAGPAESDGSIRGNARRTPNSVFDLGRCA